jgi:hypothetical protein
MKYYKTQGCKLLVISFLIILSACSSQSINDSPVSNPNIDLYPLVQTQVYNHSVIVAYELMFDSETFDLELNQIRQPAGWHVPLNSYFPNVLKITGYGFDPAHNNDFYADLKLTHPFPGSGIDGFDTRIIALLPANPGVKMFYPVFNVNANNKALLNPDNYTTLFDNLASYPGNVNPYIEYFKDQPNRIWSSTGISEDTRRFYINWDGFGGSACCTLIVDVSTGYPASSQPVKDNTPEPVEILPSINSNMTPSDGDAEIEVTFLDWQGENDIKCKIESPDLFTGTKQLFFDRPGPNPNEYIFTGTFSNEKEAPAGDYGVLIAAWDIPSGIHVYKETFVHVAMPYTGWAPDPLKTNVDMSFLAHCPKIGSDISVIDADAPWQGVLYYDNEQRIIRAELDLSDAVIYGPAKRPFNMDSSNPHSNPDKPMPGNRIEGSHLGCVIRSFTDSHRGYGPLYGRYYRNDGVAMLYYPNGSLLEEMMEMVPSDSLDMYKVVDAWDENYIIEGESIIMIVWEGCTEIRSRLCQVTENCSREDDDIPAGLSRYLSTCVAGGDSSKNISGSYIYYATNNLSGEGNTVSWYQRAMFPHYVSKYYPEALPSRILDFELIPQQTPPIELNGKTQVIDWGAVLMSNKTIEIFDPYIEGGDLVQIIDCSMLIGDLYYLDVADSSGEIYVSHSDGIKPYITVFKLM